MNSAAVSMHMQFVAGNNALVLGMIEDGTVDANARDVRGNTLLHKVISDSNMTGRLIAAGADPNIQVRSSVSSCC